MSESIDLALRAVSEALGQTLSVSQVVSAKSSSKTKYNHLYTRLVNNNCFCCRGEIVVVLSSSEKPAEDLPALLTAQANKSAGIAEFINVFKSNFKAKNQQLTVVFKLENAKSEEQKEKSRAAENSMTVSALDECSEEIISLVFEKLALSNVEQTDRSRVKASVEHILGRFQTEAFVRGFQARTHANQNLTLQAPL
jgi:hypothetical protein